MASLADSEHYYRGLLSLEARNAYDAIENGIRSFSHSVELPCGYEATDIKKLVGYVLADNPDIVWFTGDVEMRGEKSYMAGSSPITR